MSNTNKQFLNLISIAKAEGADTLAAPTFPFTPPGGTAPTPIDGDATKPKITLQTDKTTLKKDEKFIVRILIDSKEELSGFNVSISYDSEIFLVIDSDTTEPGVQIDYIDTLFVPTTNSANTSAGIINLIAAAGEGQESSISRTVAEIEFQAKATGISEITINEANSNLLSTAGIDVLEASSSLNITITQTESAPIIRESEPTPYIPKTALSDNAGLLVGGLGGILLIIVGIYLTRKGESGS